MNPIIPTLVRNDLHLNRWPMVLYLALGLISLGMLTIEVPMVFYAGVTIMLSVIIVAGVHMVMGTVTGERNDQILPFIMSLPLTFKQYTLAKVYSNLGVFLAFWVIILGGLMTVILTQPQIPDGLVVYGVILLLEMLAVFCLVLAVGLISESQSWTIVVISISNIGLSVFMFWVASFAGIKSHMNTEQVVWNQTAITFITAEVAVIVALLVITFLVQSRKKDFI